MLMLFDKKSNKRITDFGTNSMYPEGVPMDTVDLSIYDVPETDILEYRLHDENEKAKVESILNAGSIEGIIVDGIVTDIVTYKRISITTDKAEILADGTDTATITATVDDTTSTENIEFYDEDGTLLQTVQCG